jgi:hypothetical protein
MRRTDYDDHDARSQESRGGPRSELADAMDMLSRRLSGALMLAGGLIGLGIYAGSGSQEAPTYQAFAADGEVFRVNTDSGTIIACNANRCTRILERGQDLAEDQRNTLFKAPAASQLPAAQPAAPAQPQAPGAPGPVSAPAAPAQPK